MNYFRPSQSLPSTPSPFVYHIPASRQLDYARVTLSPSSRFTQDLQNIQLFPNSSQESSQASSRGSSRGSFRYHVSLSQDCTVNNNDIIHGQQLEDNFGCEYRKDEWLKLARLGFAVLHWSQPWGGRELAKIWRYGVELSYIENNDSHSKLWFRRLCHLRRSKRSAENVASYYHIMSNWGSFIGSTLTFAWCQLLRGQRRSAHLGKQQPALDWLLLRRHGKRILRKCDGRLGNTARYELSECHVISY